MSLQEFTPKYLHFLREDLGSFSDAANARFASLSPHILSEPFWHGQSPSRHPPCDNIAPPSDYPSPGLQGFRTNYRKLKGLSALSTGHGSHARDERQEQFPAQSLRVILAASQG